MQNQNNRGSQSYLRNQQRLDNQQERITQSQGHQIKRNLNSKLAYINQGKSLIAGLIFVTAQIVVVVIHSIYIRPIVQGDSDILLTPLSFFIPLVLSFASTLGFGLLFSYTKRLVLSGLGFSLFINAYCLQYYPLISAFWIQTQIFKPGLLDNQTQKPFFLSQSLFKYLPPYTTINTNSNHIEGCFRAAMSINVAISCVLGRIGIFQVFLTIIIGVFGYELNRRVCVQNFGDDALGSMYIFAFGGFMGLAMGIILRYKDRKRRATFKHKYYTANEFSVTLSLLGSAILLITLPFLTLLYHKKQVQNQFLMYSPTLCVILSSSQGLMGSLLVSLISRTSLKARDFINGPVAGAIIGGTLCYFTTNIAYCMGVGMIGGALQAAVQNILQNKFGQSHRPITTVSFALFGMQGFLSGVAGAIGKQIIQSNAQGLNYTNAGYNSVNLFVFAIISSSIGFAFGTILGAIFYFINVSPREGYFNDLYTWNISLDPDFQPQLLKPPQTTGNNQNPGSISSIRPQSIVTIPY